MNTTEQQARVIQTPRTEHKGNILAFWLSSTDHKVIGHMYLITSFFFFLCAGIMAMLMRIQLLGPDRRVMSDQQYNELFTMHGAIMLLLFATPLFIGFTKTRCCRCRSARPTWRSRGSTSSATTCSRSAGSSCWPAS